MKAKKASRRQVLLGAGAAVMAHAHGALSAGTDGWLPIAPADAGLAPDLEARLDKAIADKRVWNLHGLVVLRNDRLVLERYFEGEDHARGIGGIGRVAFKPDTLHDLRSCSKSIAVFRVSRTCRSRQQGWPRPAHHPACADDDDGHRLGREQPGLFRSAQQ